MQFFTSDTELVWGELDLPLFGINCDWTGAILNPPLGFSLAVDPVNFWFLATRQAPASILPGALPSAFTPRLWHCDVAELFLADPGGGEYLEINLAPNGAWWAAKFSAVRIPAPELPAFERHIVTYSEEDESGTWLTGMSIPLAFLRETINFGSGTAANAAFLLNSPEQTFHSAHDLGGGIPDFHRPRQFPRLSPRKLPAK